MIKQSYPPRGKAAQKQMSTADFRRLYGGGKDKSPDAQYRGGRNRQAGANFESLISAACEHYRLNGIACIEKTPEPLKVVEHIKDQYFKAVFEEKAQADYKGTVGGGNAIVFEAKHTDDISIKQSVVTKSQTKCLDTHEQLGAYCFVMVSMQNRFYFRIPWQHWKEMSARFGRKYATAEELKPYSISLGLCRQVTGGKVGLLFLD